MHKVDVEQARECLQDLIEEAMEGGEVLITRDRQPLVRLVPTAAPRERKERPFGSAKGLIHIADDFDAPLEDFRDYM
jgi:antitoxin (DNA-binding transcriptional repressor) of toxin-antitoxin stability system